MFFRLPRFHGIMCSSPSTSDLLAGHFDFTRYRGVSRAVFLASIALEDQGYGRPDEEILCRTSQGWFLPDAYVTLLPHGDAFQIWYRHQADVVPPGPDLGSPRAAASLEDRFAASLEPTPGGELVFHEGSLHNAVIISQNGLVYVDVPRFADQVTVRSAALQHVLQPGAPYRQITHFARVLPPLEELPAIQLAAVTCSGTEAPAIVDLRPLGGSLAACPVADRSLPFHRVLTAVNQFGEPDPEQPVQHRLQQGLLVVMHNEVSHRPVQSRVRCPPTPACCYSPADEPYHRVSDDSHQHFVCIS